MSTGSKLKRVGGMGFAFVLCAAIALAAPGQSHKKAAKKPPLPPLASGPTGQPVQQIPLDAIAAVPPQVTYQNNQLTIVAPNSTLGDILRAVRKQTGAEIEVPQATERVVTRLGPGPARDVLSDLLNGSRFNYVLLGSPGNEAMLTRVVLVPKAVAPGGNPGQPDNLQANAQPGAEAPPEEASGDANDAPDDGSEDPPDQPEQQEQDQQQQQQQQQGQAPEQPNIRTPQQMLQEMQQRQLQMQQQQPPNQPVAPGSGMPPNPQQEK